MTRDQKAALMVRELQKAKAEYKEANTAYERAYKALGDAGQERDLRAAAYDELFQRFARDLEYLHDD